MFALAYSAGSAGKGPLPRAASTTIENGGKVSVEGFGMGSGGCVAIWGDELVKFAGYINARGGIEGGNGGYIEVCY